MGSGSGPLCGFGVLPFVGLGSGPLWVRGPAFSGKLPEALKGAEKLSESFPEALTSSQNLLEAFEKLPGDPRKLSRSFERH